MNALIRVTKYENKPLGIFSERLSKQLGRQGFHFGLQTIIIQKKKMKTDLQRTSCSDLRA